MPVWYLMLVTTGDAFGHSAAGAWGAAGLDEGCPDHEDCTPAAVAVPSKAEGATLNLQESGRDR